MKSQIRQLILLTAPVFILAGCSAPADKAIAPGITPLGVTIVPSPTATPSPGVTLSPSATLTPVDIAHTPTTMPRPTISPAPTLTAEQQEAYIVDMLKTNGDCKLPCWWGIMPGEATLQSLQDQFRLPLP